MNFSVSVFIHAGFSFNLRILLLISAIVLYLRVFSLASTAYFVQWSS